MDLVKGESYYIKIREMYLLLAGLDIPCIYGIASDKEGIPERKEINRVLVEMYQKQIIDWEEDCIVIKQPYTDMIDILSTCQRCIVIKGLSEKLPVYCCYLAQEAVVMTERSQREEGMLCISYMSYEEWLLCIGECLETEGKNIEESIKIILEVRDSRNGTDYGKITIIEQGLQTIIIEENAQQEERCLYDREILAEKIENAIASEK